MTDSELGLLLTVARIVRAKIRGEIYAERDDDLEAITEALKPFDPSHDAPVNLENRANVRDLLKAK